MSSSGIFPKILIGIVINLIMSVIVALLVAFIIKKKEKECKECEEDDECDECKEPPKNFNPYAVKWDGSPGPRNFIFWFYSDHNKDESDKLTIIHSPTALSDKYLNILDPESQGTFMRGINFMDNDGFTRRINNKEVLIEVIKKVYPGTNLTTIESDIDGERYNLPLLLPNIVLDDAWEKMQDNTFKLGPTLYTVTDVDDMDF